ncbi:HNH endonuclease [Bacillus atrophaeus]|uniref:HNH endonuclease n=1 Tax=Bacillus atrophaeus TaxID=1452 RepID=UPI00227F0A4D|nr:HNH endonuclease [Bacillus atrophaeus]MCY8911029.1 HNH endonuclease [Bacillus atrophaeus]MCY8940650.1 HNH endonuclease [Bacillus atrophaeus]MEC0837880.1 HNH endonuclease [Bacillus atrophaeus]MEC0847321.1 HNH endonuclease [Bacillus atrophaeus]MEC0849811.1 HNH endonuclease [Bacillus atrophaeus]
MNTPILNAPDLHPIPPTGNSTFSDYRADFSGYGKVYSLKTKMYLSHFPNNTGYVYVNLIDDNGKIINVALHKVIWSAKENKPLSYLKDKNLDIHHIDGFSFNNNPNNLTSLSRKDNLCEKITKQRMKSRNRKEIASEIISLRQQFEEEGYNLFDPEDFFNVARFISVTFNKPYRTVSEILKEKKFANVI